MSLPVEERDRGFESTSLQRRVSCELDFDWLPLTDVEHALIAKAEIGKPGPPARRQRTTARPSRSSLLPLERTATFAKSLTPDGSRPSVGPWRLPAAPMCCTTGIPTCSTCYCRYGRPSAVSA